MSSSQRQKKTKSNSNPSVGDDTLHISPPSINKNRHQDHHPILQQGSRVADAASSSKTPKAKPKVGANDSQGYQSPSSAMRAIRDSSPTSSSSALQTRGRVEPQPGSAGTTISPFKAYKDMDFSNPQSILKKFGLHDRIEDLIAEMKATLSALVSIPDSPNSGSSKGNGTGRKNKQKESIEECLLYAIETGNTVIAMQRLRGFTEYCDGWLTTVEQTVREKDHQIVLLEEQLKLQQQINEQLIQHQSQGHSSPPLKQGWSGLFNQNSSPSGSNGSVVLASPTVTAVQDSSAAPPTSLLKNAARMMAKLDMDRNNLERQLRAASKQSAIQVHELQGIVDQLRVELADTQIQLTNALAANVVAIPISRERPLIENNSVISVASPSKQPPDTQVSVSTPAPSSSISLLTNGSPAIREVAANTTGLSIELLELRVQRKIWVDQLRAYEQELDKVRQSKEKVEVENALLLEQLAALEVKLLIANKENQKVPTDTTVVQETDKKHNQALDMSEAAINFHYQYQAERGEDSYDHLIKETLQGFEKMEKSLDVIREQFASTVDVQADNEAIETAHEPSNETLEGTVEGEQVPAVVVDDQENDKYMTMLNEILNLRDQLSALDECYKEQLDAVEQQEDDRKDVSELRAELVTLRVENATLEKNLSDLLMRYTSVEDALRRERKEHDSRNMVMENEGSEIDTPSKKYSDIRLIESRLADQIVANNALQDRIRELEELQRRVANDNRMEVLELSDIAADPNDEDDAHCQQEIVKMEGNGELIDPLHCSAFVEVKSLCGQLEEAVEQVCQQVSSSSSINSASLSRQDRLQDRLPPSLSLPENTNTSFRNDVISPSVCSVSSCPGCNMSEMMMMSFTIEQLLTEKTVNDQTIATLESALEDLKKELQKKQEEAKRLRKKHQGLTPLSNESGSVKSIVTIVMAETAVQCSAEVSSTGTGDAAAMTEEIGISTERIRLIESSTQSIGERVQDDMMEVATKPEVLSQVIEEQPPQTPTTLIPDNSDTVKSPTRSKNKCKKAKSSNRKDVDVPITVSTTESVVSAEYAVATTSTATTSTITSSDGTISIAEVDSLRETISCLESDWNVAKSERDAVRQELMEYQQEIQALLATSNEKVRGLESERDNVNTKLQSALERVKELEDKQIDREQEIVDLRNSVISLQTSKEEADMTLKQVQAELFAEKEKKGRVESLATPPSPGRNATATTSNSGEDKKRDKGKKGSKQPTVTSTTDELTVLRSRIAVVEQERNNAEESRNILQTQLEEKEREMESLRQDCVREAEVVSTLRESLSTKEIEINQLKQSLSTSHDDAQRQAIETVTAQNGVLEGRLRESEDRESVKDTEIAQLKDCLNQALAEKSEIERMVQSQSTETVSTAATTPMTPKDEKKKEKSMKGSKSNSNSSVNIDSESLTDRLAIVENDYKAAQERIVDLQSRLDQQCILIEALQQEKTRESEIVTTLRQCLLEKESEVDDLRHQLIELKNRSKELQSELNEAKHALTQISTLPIVSADTDTLQSQLLDRDNTVKTLLREQERDRERLNDLQTALSDRENALERVNQQYKHVKEQLQQQQRDREVARRMSFSQKDKDSENGLMPVSVPTVPITSTTIGSMESSQSSMLTLTYESQSGDIITREISKERLTEDYHQFMTALNKLSIEPHNLYDTYLIVFGAEDCTREIIADQELIQELGAPYYYRLLEKYRTMVKEVDGIHAQLEHYHDWERQRDAIKTDILDEIGVSKSSHLTSEHGERMTLQEERDHLLQQLIACRTSYAIVSSELEKMKHDANATTIGTTSLSSPPSSPSTSERRIVPASPSSPQRGRSASSSASSSVRGRAGTVFGSVLPLSSVMNAAGLGARSTSGSNRGGSRNRSKTQF